MYNTFNMGLGMVVVVAPADLERCIAGFAGAGIKASHVGEVFAAGGEPHAEIVQG
jgi:phosphoribosylformylglycinamidine cyclo-ligase